MIVVIDTNVFVRQTRLLHDGVGPLLLHFLALWKGRLFVPDILRREYFEQSIALAGEERRRIKSAFDALHALAGEIQEYTMPDGGAITAGVKKRLLDLEAITITQEMTPELKIETSDRVMGKRAPVSKTDHGYKDCMIWESILRIPAGMEVHLVSKDGAFFEGDVLAPVLASEAYARGLKVAAHRDLEDVLGLLQDGVPALDFNALQPALHAALESHRERLKAQWQLTQVGPDTTFDMDPYFTEKVGRSYVKFTVRYFAKGPNTDLIADTLWMMISGAFIWNNDGHLSELRIDWEKLATDSGLVVGENAIVHVGGFTLGSVKLPLERRGKLMQHFGPVPAGEKRSPAQGRASK